jgi:uncharacterized protein (TIGR00369 family)
VTVEDRTAVDAVTWGARRERTIAWHEPAAPDALGAMSGLEILAAIRDGMLPGPPMAEVFGFRIAEVDDGRIVFTCEPDQSTYNPLGVVHGGLVCTLADSACGCAVHTTLPAGTSYTSVDLNVSYLRAVTLDSGTLRATGIARKVGRRVAFAEASILDGQGREVATATSSLLILSGS